MHNSFHKGDHRKIKEKCCLSSQSCKNRRKKVGKVAKIITKRLEKLQKVAIIGIEKLQMQYVG